jgi:hypothetical protein
VQAFLTSFKSDGFRTSREKAIRWVDDRWLELFWNVTASTYRACSYVFAAYAASSLNQTSGPHAKYLSASGAKDESQRGVKCMSDRPTDKRKVPGPTEFIDVLHLSKNSTTSSFDGSEQTKRWSQQHTAFGRDEESIS